MYQVRLHGRGRQGVVTAAELVAWAAIADGLYALAFPSFGSERTGAPVAAYCRIDDKPIRSREPVGDPDVVVVLDPTLLRQTFVLDGLKPDGTALINSPDPQIVASTNLRAARAYTLPATDIARARTGRPLPNVPMLGALAAASGIITLAAVREAIGARFTGQVAEANGAAAADAYEYLSHGASIRPRPPFRRPQVPDSAMLPGRAIEGSRAVAETVARCRPQVVPTYPISPQTHIVEAVSALVRAGELAPCEFVNVESEFGAMSLCIGASATGSRTYTATSSQGLLFMAEALYNASGLGLPIVMTVANRAIGAPINIWNDQSDSLSQRDSGWIQLYARDNQAACDLHPVAFRLAEELSVPVMVCMDGFVLTHAVERIAVPEQQAVDSFLPRFVPRQVLDPAAPLSIGAMVGPEAFTEVRFIAHGRMQQALGRFPALAEKYGKLVGRPAEHLARGYRLDGARTVFLAMGSVLGTLEDVIDEARAGGLAVGAVELTCFRPFPAERLRTLLADAEHVVVLERAFSPGAAGIITPELAAALAGPPAMACRCSTVVAGLGGRAVTKKALRLLVADAAASRVAPSRSSA